VPAVRVRGLSYRYPDGRAALRGVDLTIMPGESIALVGPNGAGKSTLIKLLCRFYDPNEGSVEIDGVDLRDYPIDKLRRLITVLFQEPVRYSCTVAEAIALGRQPEGASRGEIEAAARAAGADEIIERLPEGYDTPLGREIEGGTGLSGGEWQRVALARAFLRKAPIILLDESTSAMDSWAEADWLGRLRTLACGRTVVIITHRFSTAMQADEIHVISDGQAVEAGSHEELLACGGRYAQSWATQTER
jgi:ATP-binding cassette, subfamily B, bacterial